MTEIHLTTIIHSEINKCFDLARDIDAHQFSAGKTNEKAIAGKTSGLCELGDTITWEARHFGIKQRLMVEIVRMDSPYVFEDRMIKGAFKSMRHEHHFKSENGKTIMTDRFFYEVPYGLLGRLFNKIILKRYMTRFLKNRNEVLKAVLDKKD